MQQEQWQCRWSPTLGELESDALSVWGTPPYNPEADLNEPCIWFGLYSLRDFYSIWRHKGKRAILWCGSDITHFINGYWLDDKGRIRINSAPLAKWINENCDSYVENNVEMEALKKLGIRSKVCPSFLGKVEDYSVSYKWNERPKIYASISGNDFILYCWDKIEEIAAKVPWADFYLYGNTESWPTKNKNVFVRGRVEKEIMNEEIKSMSCGLRLLEFDGASEILVKNLLYGGYPKISHIV